MLMVQRNAKLNTPVEAVASADGIRIAFAFGYFRCTGCQVRLHVYIFHHAKQLVVGKYTSRHAQIERTEGNIITEAPNCKRR